jgi:hypothetical protein
VVHPRAWNRNSENFGCIAFSEVRQGRRVGIKPRWCSNWCRDTSARSQGASNSVDLQVIRERAWKDSNLRLAV